MYFKTQLQDPFLAVERNLSDECLKTVTQFISSLKDKAIPPSQLIWAYRSKMEQLNEIWRTKCKKQLKAGRTTKSIFVQSLPTYSLSKFALEKLNFKFHHQGAFRRMKYTYQSFIEMAKMETAMLLYKYDPVCPYEVEIAILTLLFKYFDLYSVDALTDTQYWSIQASDIRNCIEHIFNSQLSDLRPYFILIQADCRLIRSPKDDKPEIVKTRPTCADDLKKCFVEGMNQTEKKQAIMEYWGIPSIRSAERYMAKFGLTRSYMRKKTEDDKKVESNVQEDDDAVRSERDHLRRENEQLHDEVVKLNEEVVKLNEEVTRLTIERNDLRIALRHRKS